MASAVLAKRYNAAPGKPSNANQNRGATTESLRFSANDSMADSRTSSALKPLTSRLTRRANCTRPADTDWPNATSTANTSSRNMRQASRGLSSSASTAVASRPCSTSASCWSPHETIKIIAVRHDHTRTPSQKRLKSRATGVFGATRSPAHCKALPIHTTGCQVAGGSPQRWSITNARGTAKKATHQAPENAAGINICMPPSPPPSAAKRPTAFAVSSDSAAPALTAKGCQSGP